jgi:hypothetical protein
MGFWDWLTGKPKGIEVVDRIWLNQEWTNGDNT